MAVKAAMKRLAVAKVLAPTNGDLVSPLAREAVVAVKPAKAVGGRPPEYLTAGDWENWADRHWADSCRTWPHQTGKRHSRNCSDWRWPTDVRIVASGVAAPARGSGPGCKAGSPRDCSDSGT